MTALKMWNFPVRQRLNLSEILKALAEEMIDQLIS